MTARQFLPSLTAFAFSLCATLFCVSTAQACTRAVYLGP